MQLKIETVNDGKIPSYMTNGASGADCYSNIDCFIVPNSVKKIPLGFKLQIPEGYEVQLRPRSGLALKNGITLNNSPATIDSDYTGEVCAIVINHGKETFDIEKGMRICQMVLVKTERASFIEGIVDLTERSENGFGSTGVK